MDSFTDCKVSANLPSRTFALAFVKEQQLLSVIDDVLLLADKDKVETLLLSIANSELLFDDKGLSTVIGFASGKCNAEV